MTPGETTVELLERMSEQTSEVVMRELATPVAAEKTKKPRKKRAYKPRRLIPRKTTIPFPEGAEGVIVKMTKAKYTHALLVEKPKRNGWQLVVLSSNLRRLQLRMEKLEKLWMEARRLWIVEVEQEKPPRRTSPKKKAVKPIGPALALTRPQLRGLRRVWAGEGSLPYWHLSASTRGVIEARGLAENVGGKMRITEAGEALMGGARGKEAEFAP